ncbi:methyltransferase domain-containing protein [Paenibacillus aceris]|uniref:Ubiquinone/menaquinone biosynthesis C-methylase UbiE n=1 Tax=Paenibacillus aceris TaxID=869555 RepID=A0ABS4I117_9BACL|nr:ubiquinone/menaquinone biosynthesis C-methylase UbiE [Paenibacillus aceris]NHW36579.1 class I SAM-dependent methyltransferase [Paenibacillus aceris]
MDDSVLDFYDDLAENYHLIFVDWKQAISWQGEVLSEIIHSKLASSSNGVISLLDCSCGIGTQAIGLAGHGFKVTGTDLSPVSVKRAQKEAETLGVDIHFGVADLRSLENDVSDIFDVVLSADNAVPHLLTDEDLFLAASNMYAKVKKDGVLLITMRDYDELVKEKHRSTEPRVFDEGKRIVFQIWDWAEDSKTYLINHFLMREMDGQWITKHNKTRYRALLRDEFSYMLRTVGFSDIEWYMPSESGYYQPIVIARKS